MNRRQMLGSMAWSGVAGGLVAVSGGCARPVGDGSVEARIHHRLAALFRGADRRAALGVGRRVLEKLGPLRADLKALYLAVFDGASWHAHSGDDAWRLSRMVEADFEAGRTARVGGWVLSSTEMYLAATFALAVTAVGEDDEASADERDGEDDEGEDEDEDENEDDGEDEQGEEEGGEGDDGEVAYAPSPARGKKIYQTHCVSCHQVDAAGLDGQTAPDIRRALNRPEAQLRRIVVRGRESERGRMPAFGEVLTDEEIDDVVAYARKSLADPPAPRRPVRAAKPTPK